MPQCESRWPIVAERTGADLDIDNQGAGHGLKRLSYILDGDPSIMLASYHRDNSGSFFLIVVLDILSTRCD